MGVCANLRQLKIGGAVLTVTALIGCLVVNARFVYRTTLFWRYRKIILTRPSQLTVSYGCSFVVAVFTAFVALFLLVPTILTLFGLTSILTTILFVVGIVFYLAVLIAGAVSVGAVTITISNANTIEQDARNLNTSADINEYLIKYQNYRNASNKTYPVLTSTTLPATQARTTEAPTTEAPTTEAPTSEALTTQTPTPEVAPTPGAGAVELVVNPPLPRKRGFRGRLQNVPEAEAPARGGFEKLRVLAGEGARLQAPKPTAGPAKITPLPKVTIGDVCINELTGVTWDVLARPAVKTILLGKGAFDDIIPEYRLFTYKPTFTTSVSISDYSNASFFFNEVWPVDLSGNAYEPRYAFGVTVDGKSYDDALAAKDVCKWSIGGERFGPEWDKETLQSYWCEEYTYCLAEMLIYEAILTVLKDSECASFGGTWINNFCQFPVGWRNIEAYKSFLYEWEAPGQANLFAGLFLPWGDERYGILAYYSANLQPLIYGAVGIVILIPGLIAGCVASTDDE